MCGILGFCSKEKNKFKNLNVSGIKDRGPDNIGKYENENIGLYHTRLAIIDNKETSNQPIQNKDYYLICNGEVYNHKELKKELNFNFTTNSDCETIIAVYDKFGIDGFDKLDGMYSFALYDRKRDKLILHKDSVGKKPLFYYLKDDYIIFSSNITAIKENLKEQLSINKEQIEFFLDNKYIEPTKSIYNGILPLLPGEIININISNFNISNHKLKNEYKFNIDFNNEDEIKNKIFELIQKAIYKRIKDVKTPVILFSGGIDSTIIGYEALKLNKNTKFLSIKQPLPFLNDEPYIIEFAKKFEVNINYVNIMNCSFVRNIDNFINKLDQPLGVISYYYLSALALQAKSYDNVLLTGDGADEIFYGYSDFDKWIDEYGINKSLINCPYNFQLSKWGYNQVNTALLGHGFVKVDKSTAENQMEARNPFLDKELICFIRKIPKEFWQNKDIKFILKEYLIDKGFSKGFVYRKKVGFAFPFRYLIIFKYKKILNTLIKSKQLLKEFDIQLENLNYVKLYKNFDFYFNIYVLVKFLENNVKK